MILKKILQELILIRKELQAIRGSMELRKKGDGVFEETTYWFIGEPYQVEVSFLLPYRDWFVLQKLPSWVQFCESLAQIQN